MPGSKISTAIEYRSPANIKGGIWWIEFLTNTQEVDQRKVTSRARRAALKRPENHMAAPQNRKCSAYLIPPHGFYPLRCYAKWLL
jgi:hypothetical protein